MKNIYPLICAMTLVLTFTARAKVFRQTTSNPDLRVVSVTVPAVMSRPLIVQLRLSVRDGTDPIAVSSEWLTVKISRPKDEWEMVFDGDVQFVGTTNRIATVTSGTTNEVKLAVSSDRFTKKSWADLPNGKYRLRVYLTGSKTADHDYQWLGQTYSTGYDFEIRMNGDSQ